eukprot:6501075-Pyramimonas_sp.AAC.1
MNYYLNAYIGGSYMPRVNRALKSLLEQMTTGLPPPPTPIPLHKIHIAAAPLYFFLCGHLCIYSKRYPMPPAAPPHPPLHLQPLQLWVRARARGAGARGFQTGAQPRSRR